MVKFEVDFQALVETTNDFIWKVDADGVYIYCSPQCKTILGYSPQEMLGNTPFDFMPAEEAERIRHEFNEIVEKGKPFSQLENINLHKDGHEVILETSGTPFFDADRNLAGFQGIDRDITRRKHFESVIREQSKFLQSVMNGVKDPIMVIEKDYTVRMMNNAARESINVEYVSDFEHPKCYELCHHRHDPCDGAEYPCLLRQTKESGQATTVIHNHPAKDGTPRYMELIATPMWEDDQVSGIIAISRDITSHILVQKELEEKKITLGYMAHHDSLTGLPNRLLLQDRLEQSIRKAHRNNEQLAVFFIDLDKFKAINDRFGHAAGDDALKTTAMRLRAAVREGDTVSRYGGDEFIVVMDAIDNQEDLDAMAEKLATTVNEPVDVDDHRITITASIGVSIYPHDGLDAESLLKKSDFAMYEVKAIRDNLAQHKLNQPDT